MTSSVTIPAPVSTEELLAFLRDPASYPHRPAHVEIIQTHISYMAIAAPYVYKVKKPVDLGFLDFSTLDKRHYYCHEEVRLNRRLCPDTYEGVVSIIRWQGALAFGAGENTVEYAVKMKRLCEGCFLHQKLNRGTLTRDHLNCIAKTLTRFYEAEVPTAEMAAWGRTERLKISTDENFEQTEPYVGDLLSRPAFEAIRYYTNRFYDYHARLLNRRRAEGHIRDCHGDLRLEHIHLTSEAVCVYDCIEFNERLRYIDVANDIAFLTMDLDVNGRSDLAIYFTSQMTQALNDPDLPVLIDFYKCYRAYVRAKVESIRSREPEVPEEERQTSRERARHYYRLALRYAIAGSKPLVVVVMGGIGTGKSTIARLLGEALGWTVQSSDRTRKELAGVPLYERGSEAVRADLYNRKWTLATYAALHEAAIQRVHDHQGVILDASHSRRSLRDALRTTLQQENIPYCFVELVASEAVIKQRLQAREQAHRIITDARLEDFEMIHARYEAPDDLEDARHFTTSSDASPETVVLDVLQHLVRFNL